MGLPLDKCLVERTVETVILSPLLNFDGHHWLLQPRKISRVYST